MDMLSKQTTLRPNKFKLFFAFIEDRNNLQASINDANNTSKKFKIKRKEKS
jgi:hypothetical protein